MHVSDGPSQNYGHQQVSKRVCRNLTAEICSEIHQNAAPSESNLDLWVLRTLGLKDRDTIDTSDRFSPSSGSGLASVYDSEQTLGFSVSSSPPSSAHTYCQTGYGYDQDANGSNSTSSLGQHFTASGLTGHYELPDVVTGSYTTAFGPSPARAEICSTAASGPEPAAYWTPLQGGQTPSQDAVAPSTIRGYRPPTRPQPPATGSCRTELAFSMSLSPSSSVKTHSFPQGQAFVRKDGEGRWSFTWVPRQGP